MTRQELQIFESILEYFQKKKVVERIAKAEDKIGTFKKIQGSLEKSLRQLRIDVKRPLKNREITPKEVLEVCTMCLMAEMDDFELLDDYWQLVIALQRVKGDKEEIANNFSNFLSKSNIFSEERLEDLIERFYTQTQN